MANIANYTLHKNQVYVYDVALFNVSIYFQHILCMMYALKLII